MKQKRKFYEKNFDMLKVVHQQIIARSFMKINITYLRSFIMRSSKIFDINALNGSKTFKNTFLSDNLNPLFKNLKNDQIDFPLQIYFINLVSFLLLSLLNSFWKSTSQSFNSQNLNKKQSKQQDLKTILLRINSTD